MIAPTTKLKQSILQALEEINDALYAARQQGLIVLLPEEVDMQVSMVTDINAVSRTNTDSEADGGTTTTLREQLNADSETRNSTSSGESNENRTSTTRGDSNESRNSTTIGSVNENRQSQTQRTSGESRDTNENNNVNTVTNVGTSTETHTTTHPGITTTQTGTDTTNEDVTNTYDA